MRFLFTLIIWIVIVGGLSLYVSYRDAAVSRIAPQKIQEQKAVGTFNLEITPTFSVEKDPFALDTGSQEQASLEIRINGKQVALPENTVQRGRPILIKEIENIFKGNNEIYIKASPPLSEGNLNHGVRVQLLQDDDIMASETIWSSQGSLVSGTVAFDWDAREEEEHDN